MKDKFINNSQKNYLIGQFLEAFITTEQTEVSRNAILKSIIKEYNVVQPKKSEVPVHDPQKLKVRESHVPYSNNEHYGRHALDRENKHQHARHIGLSTSKPAEEDLVEEEVHNKKAMKVSHRGRQTELSASKSFQEDVGEKLHNVGANKERGAPVPYSNNERCGHHALDRENKRQNGRQVELCTSKPAQEDIVGDQVHTLGAIKVSRAKQGFNKVDGESFVMATPHHNGKGTANMHKDHDNNPTHDNLQYSKHLGLMKKKSNKKILSYACEQTHEEDKSVYGQFVDGLPNRKSDQWDGDEVTSRHCKFTGLQQNGNLNDVEQSHVGSFNCQEKRKSQPKDIPDNLRTSQHEEVLHSNLDHLKKTKSPRDFGRTQHEEEVTCTDLDYPKKNESKWRPHNIQKEVQSVNTDLDNTCKEKDDVWNAHLHGIGGNGAVPLGANPSTYTSQENLYRVKNRKNGGLHECADIGDTSAFNTNAHMLQVDSQQGQIERTHDVAGAAYDTFRSRREKKHTRADYASDRLVEASNDNRGNRNNLKDIQRERSMTDQNNIQNSFVHVGVKAEIEAHENYRGSMIDCNFVHHTQEDCSLSKMQRRSRRTRKNKHNDGTLPGKLMDRKVDMLKMTEKHVNDEVFLSSEPANEYMTHDKGITPKENGWPINCKKPEKGLHFPECKEESAVIWDEDRPDDSEQGNMGKNQSDRNISSNLMNVSLSKPPDRPPPPVPHQRLHSLPNSRRPIPIPPERSVTLDPNQIRSIQEPHVHPKLPEYEDLVASFTALRKANRRDEV
ncbi:hypothetical protein KP509_16G019800 [Ceratopteris richardii]|uniref:Uncharacterized protein n=1 Tax=Ceratopteris richardii TaxID=49495 RepID=A0A8T2T048_CERRI|nr:hypothetical protein KP509_16G019800 [Ceratopteris richardii]